MTIISPSRKLLWCLDLIFRRLKKIFTGHEDRWSKKLPDDVLQLILQRLLMSDYFSCRDVCRSWRAAIDSFTGHEDRWSKKLPDDVLQLILQRLLMSDYFSCRDVCRSWRAAIDSKHCLHSDQFPWLLLDSRYSFYIKDDCFVNDRKICKSKKNHTEYWRQCVGSIEGLLIMTTSHTDSLPLKVRFFFFLNPVSGARVMLPSLSEPKYFHILKAVASSVPMKTRSCYVSCLYRFKKEVRLALCMPGDKSWTFIEVKTDEGDHEKALKFWDIEIVDGKLDALRTSYELQVLMVFEIQLDTNGHGIHTYTAERMVTRYPNIGRIVEDLVYIRKCYLAKGNSESKEELFMIRHNVILDSSISERTRGFQVLKLEYNVTTDPQWVEIVELGDHVLFMGGLNNKFISSGSTSHDQTVPERNSIYFVFRWSHRVCECGVFSLTNSCIKRFKPLTLPEGSLTAVDSLWFTPNPW